jgi:hypothetical protein
MILEMTIICLSLMVVIGCSAYIVWSLVDEMREVRREKLRLLGHRLHGEGHAGALSVQGLAGRERRPQDAEKRP